MQGTYFFRCHENRSVLRY